MTHSLPSPSRDATSSTQHTTADTAEALGLELARSAEPGVVLTSLAAACVPGLCDACTVELRVDGQRRHIERPAPVLVRTVAPGAVGTTVHVPFADVAGSTYAGTVSFTWRARTPTPGDRFAVALLVDCAVRTIEWQRNAQSCRAAEARNDNLEQALTSSRHIGAAIGIVMTTHKVREDAAFTALQKASQRTNRKLRVLALDVIDTGWLDPEVISLESPSTL